MTCSISAHRPSPARTSTAITDTTVTRVVRVALEVRDAMNAL
ncbi:hypothetical protein GJR88_00844 [Dietzia sp. DQ12-45-1b]|nr:hypothetical protein GJR88_00844 [Dietzia sp. DQ12-45-1b]